jgi:hypothetical protein
MRNGGSHTGSRSMLRRIESLAVQRAAVRIDRTIASRVTSVCPSTDQVNAS